MTRATKLRRDPKAFFVDGWRKWTLQAVQRDLSSANRALAPAAAALRGSTAGSASQSGEIPGWFNAQAGDTLASALEENGNIFLYTPWMAGHGDRLVKAVGAQDLPIVAFDLVKDIHEKKRRSEILRFAHMNPALYRRLVISRLLPIRSRIHAMLFTLDWTPAMRIISSVCEELDITRILIPHESVFADEELYYSDPVSKASVPTADLVLGWGGLQKRIFCGRGYEQDRFIPVGSPKLDAYHDYAPLTSRASFHRVFGLDPEKKTILFAMQPLDSQFTGDPLAAQREAIDDLLGFAEATERQLLVRLPPSGARHLGKELEDRLLASGIACLDNPPCYLVPPEEAIFHADLVASINSTMLFEAILLGRPALSCKYTPFTSFWHKAGIREAESRASLFAEAEALLSAPPRLEGSALAWAANELSNGAFDGGATERVRGILREIADGRRIVRSRPSALDRVLARQPVDVVATASAQTAVDTSQLFLREMLGARQLISRDGGDPFGSADLFVQWGITPNPAKTRHRSLAREMGKPVLIVEDGFLRSVGIGLSGEPGLSIIVDDTTAYYDATKPSRLARRLESGPGLTDAEQSRSENVIERIVKARLSKYNHAPDIPLQVGRPERRKLLLVDQREGDQSVVSGLADAQTFNRMVADVMRERQGWDIIVKQHPDAITGGKKSYLNRETLAFARDRDDIHFIDFDCNPFALLDIVEEVYVVASGLGFEALMAGKSVHCYGMPFYAGWGVTTDKMALSSRTRTRTVPEIFHYAYIEASRYYSPDLNGRCEIEDLISYLENSTKT